MTRPPFVLERLVKLNEAPGGCYSTAEQTIGIIVGCMPVLPVLYRHISEHYFTTTKSKSTAKVFVNSFFAQQRDLGAPGPDLRSDDASTLRGYQELADFEGR